MHKVGPFHTSPDICEAYNTQYLTHGMARISAVPICKPQAIHALGMSNLGANTSSSCFLLRAKCLLV